MYKIKYLCENPQNNFSKTELSSLDVDNFLALEGSDMLESCAMSLIEDNNVSCTLDPFKDPWDDDFVAEDPKQHPTITIYVDSTLSTLLEILEAFHVVQIDLSTMALSNLVDDSIIPSLIITKR